MEKLLIVGEYYSTNLGDGILCETTKNELHNRFDFEFDFFDLSLKSCFSEEQKIEAFSLKRKQLSFIKKRIEYFLESAGIDINNIRLKRQYLQYGNTLKNVLNTNKYDGIVFAGGQIFNDTFLERVLVTVRMAEFYHIPVYFNACGCGNILSKKKIGIINSIISSNIVHYVSLRDGFNRLQIKSDLVNIYETYDTAIVSSRYFERSYPRKKMGIGIMLSKFHPVGLQIDFWKQLLTQLIRNNIDFEVFCNGSPYDYAFIIHIFNSLNLDYRNYCAKRPIYPNELVKIITCYERIISMRLHSLIVAYSYNIPAVAISWDKKVPEFYKKISEKEKVFYFNSKISDIMDAVYFLGYSSNIKNSIVDAIDHNIDQLANIIKDDYDKREGK